MLENLSTRSRRRSWSKCTAIEYGFQLSLLLVLKVSMKPGLSYDVPRIPGRREDESHGHLHQVGEGVGFHFLHHLASVRLHGDLTNSQLQTNLFIQHAGDY